MKKTEFDTDEYQNALNECWKAYQFLKQNFDIMCKMPCVDATKQGIVNSMKKNITDDIDACWRDIRILSTHQMTKKEGK